MSEREYPVPDFPGYTVKEDGTIISYRKHKDGKPLKAYQLPRGSTRTGTKRKAYAVQLGWPPSDPRYVPHKGYTATIHKIVCSAKYGRWPEPWEEVRHLDGDPTNNSMSNLEFGDHLNNIIDDYFNGTRLTNVDEIDKAINKLMMLREKMEQEKSPTD